MKKAFSLISKKIKAVSGESLVETLVALLIAALALAMLAGMVNTAVKLTGSSSEYFDKYYAASNDMAGRNASCKLSSSGKVTLKGSDGKTYNFNNETINVEYYLNKESGEKTPVVAYSRTVK